MALLSIRVFWDVMLCCRVIDDLDTEGNSCFETSGGSGPRAQRHIPESLNPVSHLFL